MAECPRCGCSALLPVPPLFSREEVCALVPVKNTTLRRWCARNGSLLDQPLYTGPKTRRRRLFSARDVRTLRASLVSSHG